MSLHKIAVLFSLITVLCPGTLCAAPASAKKFIEIKSAYLSLRNTDPKVEREVEWEELADRFTKYVERYPASSQSSQALYLTSILYEHLFHGSGNKSYLNLCLDNLKRIAEHYKDSEYADDALFKRAELNLSEIKNVPVAKKLYEILVAEYPNGDMADVAALRLKEVLGGDKSLEKQDPSIKSLRAGPIIVIDPGHGGEDLGAPGIAGLLEKDVVLAVAMELEKIIKEKNAGQVYLTRRGDIFVPLATRTEMANEAKADLFISLHVNSSPGGRARGLEVYYLDNTRDRASMKLAERENASVQFEGPEGDLRYMLSDLIQSGKLSSSIQLAHDIGDQLANYLKPKYTGIKNLGVKKAPFYVLVGAHMPCVLVEMFFVNNETEGTLLSTKDFRKDLARGVYRGIQAYLPSK